MIKPILDQTFEPAIIAIRDFNKKVSKYENKQHIIIAVERDQNYIYRREFDILPKGVDDKLNNYIVERYIKTILWLVGGFKIYIAGSHDVYKEIKSYYSPKYPNISSSFIHILNISSSKLKLFLIFSQNVL